MTTASDRYLAELIDRLQTIRTTLATPMEEAVAAIVEAVGHSVH